MLVMAGNGGSGSIQLGGAAPVVEVTLTPACPPAGGDPSIRAFEVGGGCVTYRSSLPVGVGPVPSFDSAADLSYIPRSELVAFVDRDEDLVLCGAEAACPT
jgi:hypothetical protein